MAVVPPPGEQQVVPKSNPQAKALTMQFPSVAADDFAAEAAKFRTRIAQMLDISEDRVRVTGAPPRTTNLIQTADGSLLGGGASAGSEGKVVLLEGLTPEQDTEEMSLDECVEFMEKQTPAEINNVLGTVAYTVGEAVSVQVSLTPPPSDAESQTTTTTPATPGTPATPTTPAAPLMNGDPRLYEDPDASDVAAPVRAHGHVCRRARVHLCAAVL